MHRIQPRHAQLTRIPHAVIPVTMQRDPLTISPDASLGEAFERMLESDAGCLLVVARGQLLGIVTERDLLEAAVALVSKGVGG